jgi:hypothetical protein
MNDNKEVDVKMPQKMKCILWYNNPILIINAKTQSRNTIILYNTTNGITTLEKHAFP